MQGEEGGVSCRPGGAVQGEEGGLSCRAGGLLRGWRGASAAGQERLSMVSL